MRVLQLVGSAETDALADLSRLYAADALEVIGGDVAHVSPDGAWRFPTDLRPASLAAATPHTLAAAVGHLDGMQVDVAVPQMFCRPGMTDYRALLGLLGIPYVGNLPATMALGTDKAAARAVAAAAGVAVPTGFVAARGESVTVDDASGLHLARVGQMDRRLAGPSLPVVVKPVAADNSDGVTLVRAADELDAALAAAWTHGDALVETYVPAGREVRCGLLERDGELVALPLEEYPVGDAHPIRVAADKLGGSGDDLKLMAKTADAAWIVDADDPVCPPVWEAARRCHRALGCRHYSLFDFRVDPENRPWFLEAGLYCSFARASVVAVMAAAAGIATQELFHICAEEALR